MVTPIDELKVRAKKLLKFSPNLPELLSIAKSHQVQLKHCQHFVAQKMGFTDWIHAKQVLACCEQPLKDYGRFWYTNKCATLLNHWCSNLDDAKAVARQAGGVVLPYNTQFFVAVPTHFNNLGMDYDACLWEQIRCNWLAGDRKIRMALALMRINAVPGIRASDTKLLEV